MKFVTKLLKALGFSSELGPSESVQEIETQTDKMEAIDKIIKSVSGRNSVGEERGIPNSKDPQRKSVARQGSVLRKVTERKARGAKKVVKKKTARKVTSRKKKSTR